MNWTELNFGITMQYGATFFRDTFARFIAGWHNPDLTRAQLEHESMNVIIPFTAVSVYQCLKFTNVGKTETEDSLHVYPLRHKKNGRTDDARFDTALVRIGAIGETGIQAFRVAQVRAIFSISQAARSLERTSNLVARFHNTLHTSNGLHAFDRNHISKLPATVASKLAHHPHGPTLSPALQQPASCCDFSNLSSLNLSDDLQDCLQEHIEAKPVLEGIVGQWPRASRYTIDLV
ncbi:hypothetical protein JOM56_001546 [Amanita muscaria]